MKKYYYYFVIWLTVHVGKVKQILCCDWVRQHSGSYIFGLSQGRLERPLERTKALVMDTSIILAFYCCFQCCLLCALFRTCVL